MRLRLQMNDNVGPYLLTSTGGVNDQLLPNKFVNLNGDNMPLQSIWHTSQLITVPGSSADKDVQAQHLISM